jgi:RNA methyltransferase, TrmH family
VITSPHNDKLKTVRRLHDKRHRSATGLFVAEGEDLVAAAEAAGVEPEVLLVAAPDGGPAVTARGAESVLPELLDGVSALGSGTRVIGVYRQRWSAPGGDLAVYLHAVGDPGNVGAVIRSAHALADGPVILGPGCADPYSPKAVRASMGSIFARPPARADLQELSATLVALEQRAGVSLSELRALPGPVVLCLGAEREGLPAHVTERCALHAHIPVQADGPDSLNVAMAATVAMYERTRCSA